MIHLAGVTEELEILKREANDLLKTRTGHTLRQKSRKQTIEESTENIEQITPSTEGTLQDLTSTLEVYLKDFEETAEKHPVVCTLAAFALGALVSQFFTRK